MWLRGDKRVGPKPIGMPHRVGCNLAPCAPIIKKRPWALELVVTHAPFDTVRAGGMQWAAHAIRQIGDGKPRTLSERALLDAHPEGTPQVSRASSVAASSSTGRDEESGDLGDDGN